MSGLWQRLFAWFAAPDPNDTPVDSDFLRTTGISFDAQDDMRVPGEDTHKLHVRTLREHYGPSYWDRLNDESKARQGKE